MKYQTLFSGNSKKKKTCLEMSAEIFTQHAKCLMYLPADIADMCYSKIGRQGVFIHLRCSVRFKLPSFEKTSATL